MFGAGQQPENEFLIKVLKYQTGFFQKNKPTKIKERLVIHKSPYFENVLFPTDIAIFSGLNHRSQR